MQALEMKIYNQWLMEMKIIQQMYKTEWLKEQQNHKKQEQII